MRKERVLKLAKEQGYSNVVKSDDWRGYEVWETWTSDGAKIGLPLVILVKGGKIRMSTPDEAFARLDDLPDGE